MSKKAKCLSLALSLTLLLCNSESSQAKDLYNKTNHRYLSRIIQHEAGASYCNDYTRYMVGVVVLKRVKSPLFPNSVKDVLLQDNPQQYMTEYEFSLVKPSKKCRKISKKLLKGGFKGIKSYPDNLLYHANFVQGRGVYRQSNGIYFCLH